MAPTGGLEPLSKPLVFACVCKKRRRPHYSWFKHPQPSQELMRAGTHIKDLEENEGYEEDESKNSGDRRRNL